MNNSDHIYMHYYKSVEVKKPEYIFDCSKNLVYSLCWDYLQTSFNK